jgi:hypothetical protein
MWSTAIHRRFLAGAHKEWRGFRPAAVFSPAAVCGPLVPVVAASTVCTRGGWLFSRFHFPGKSPMHRYANHAGRLTQRKDHDPTNLDHYAA